MVCEMNRMPVAVQICLVLLLPLVKLRMQVCEALLLKPFYFTQVKKQRAVTVQCKLFGGHLCSPEGMFVLLSLKCAPRRAGR